MRTNLRQIQEPDAPRSRPAALAGGALLRSSSYFLTDKDLNKITPFSGHLAEDR